MSAIATLRHIKVSVQDFFRRRRSIPIASAAVVIAIALFGIFYIKPEPFPATVREASPIHSEELLARAVWLVLFVATGTGMIGIVALSCVVIGRQASPLDRRRAWLRTTGKWAFCVFGVSLVFSFEDQCSGLTSAWNALVFLQTRFSMQMFFHFFDATCAVTTVCVVSAVSSTCLCIDEVDLLTPKQLKSAMDDLRVMLYGTALVLTVAVTELYAVHSWAAKYVHVADRPEYTMLAITLAGCLGALYTCLLAAMFLPIAFMHLRAADDLAARSLSNGSKSQARREWLKENDLFPDPFSAIGRVSAVLGPLFSGGVFPAIVAIMEK